MPRARGGAGPVKKFWSVFRWFLLAYFIYAVVKSPDAAAEIVRTLFQLLGDAFRGIIGVFDAILGRT
ncbi:MAG: hypothetical protein IPL45_00895 [Actinomycetales bacterium]|nr:hypothetical protein [Actinomycetales bacterium]